jgi:hexosaminidase
MEWFTDKGLQVMGATAGQTRWVLMPQNESNMENIMSFAVNSIEKGLGGLLLTLWDDDSPHFELYMRGILAFAEYSWSGAVRSRDEIKAAFRHREYSGTLSGEEYAFVDRLEEMAGWWNPSLLKIRSRNALRSMTDPLEEGIIDLPSKSAKGAWTGKNQERLEAARKVVMDCDELAATIASMKSMALRNNYRLEVYEQVNELVRFSAHALLVLQAYDEASAGQEKSEALARIRALQEEFVLLRTNLERVYSQTRILAKPRDYLLDQDHHHHLANQSISFDWQFNAELLFLEKIDREFQAR